MRQTAENHARSFAKLSELGAAVCSEVMRVGNAVLPQVVAGRHLAAEAVAPVGDLHVVGAVGRGLHQHRHLQRGVADSVGDAALFAEVRQRHDDAVDLVAMLAEELRAAARLIRSLHRAEFRLLRRQRDDAYPRLLPARRSSPLCLPWPDGRGRSRDCQQSMQALQFCHDPNQIFLLTTLDSGTVL